MIRDWTTTLVVASTVPQPDLSDVVLLDVRSVVALPQRHDALREIL
jgi:hypothetical protein